MILTGSIRSQIGLAVMTIVTALSLMAFVSFGVENLLLKSKVKELETEKTTLLAEAMIKRMEVTGLKNSLGDQERRIQAFENTATQMAAARLKAQQEGEQRVLLLQNRIAWLEQDKGASCTVAGIGQTILNEVLP